MLNIACKEVAFEISNHYPMAAMCHVLEHSDTEICMQCKENTLWVLEYFFAGV